MASNGNGSDDYGAFPSNAPDLFPSSLQQGQNSYSYTDSVVVEGTELDSKGLSWTSSLLESLKPQNVATMSVTRDSDSYNMRHPNRGKAVIFNHSKFSNGQTSRQGTEKDELNLKTCLQAFGFEVQVYKDLQKLKILETLDRLKREDHSANDCLMVIVLSHGEQDKIFSEDSEYRPEELWNPFTADRCPTLAGKPKIFLIQACRGDQLDGGTVLRSRTQTDSPSLKKREKTYIVPNRADFLIVFSTAPGYYSWRNTTDGSWFIQAVVRTLTTYRDKKDLLSMMTIVAREVALNFQSNVPSSPLFDQKKQVPMISSTLIRDIYL